MIIIHLRTLDDIRKSRLDCTLNILFGLVYFFNSASTPYGLSNAEIWIICKCLIMTYTFIVLLLRFFKIALFYLSVCCIATYKYKQKNNQTWFMNFNEWKNTLLYKNMYLTHFILERIDVSVVCERWVETGTDCYIDPTSFPDHSSTCSASWLGLLNWGSLRATTLSLQAGLNSGLPVSN